MKRILLSFLLFLSFGLTNKALADACTITNVRFIIKSITPGTNSCTITFDVSFNAGVNPGSKYALVHLWTNQTYPSSTNVYPSSVANSFATLVVQDPGKATPTGLTTFPSDLGVSLANPATFFSLNSSNFEYTPLSNQTRTFTFRNLKLVINDCNQKVSIVGDVWATQSNSKAHCISPNVINVIVNDPEIRGQSNCSTPATRYFNVSFITAAEQSITFSAYEDGNENGQFDQADVDGGKLSLSGGPGIAANGKDVTLTVPAGNQIPYGNYFYTPKDPTKRARVFIVAKVGNNNYENVFLLENGCALTPMPVSFKSFTATRSSSATSLKWTTSTEINNKGFYVQRFYNGQWENLMFIATKAEGGNSSADLNYSYDDNFNFKGVAQYRILQVDIDGKSKYSMVRSVSNGSQAGSISVYPNPAPSNTNVSIVLGDATSTYDIQIVDNSGRIVKEFAAVKNTQQISNLPKGQYLARVKQRDNNQVSVEKFIVQ